MTTENKKDYIKCYISKIKGFINYVEKSTIDAKKLINYKVITVTASTANNDCFGNMFIGEQTDVHSESYISFNVNTKKEARSLLSYLQTRFANFLLKLRKITHNISENTCKWIPLPPLNTEWTDEEIYKHFKLSEEEIKLINDTNIIGYKNIIKQTEENIEPTSKPKRVIKKKIRVPETIIKQSDDIEQKNN